MNTNNTNFKCPHCGHEFDGCMSLSTATGEVQTGFSDGRVNICSKCFRSSVVKDGALVPLTKEIAEGLSPNAIRDSERIEKIIAFYAREAGKMGAPEGMAIILYQKFVELMLRTRNDRDLMDLLDVLGYGSVAYEPGEKPWMSMMAVITSWFCREDRAIGAFQDAMHVLHEFIQDGEVHQDGDSPQRWIVDMDVANDATALLRKYFRANDERDSAWVAEWRDKIKSPLRDKIVEIAKKWPGHEGVGWDAVSEENLLMLIGDAVDLDRSRLTNEPVADLADDIS